MNDIRKFAEELVSLTDSEVRHLADVLKKEYDIEENVPAIQNNSCSLNRQQRRKLERERRKNDETEYEKISQRTDECV